VGEVIGPPQPASDYKIEVEGFEWSALEVLTQASYSRVRSRSGTR
jgi:hypothetical protein